MTARALSVGWFVDHLMRGPVTTAIGLGHGHLRVGDYVVSFTPPGFPRMPNGIECSITPREGEEAAIGGGVLRVGEREVVPGPIWDSRPGVHVLLDSSPHQHPDVAALVGSGPGLTPLGDDVLVGFVAGRVLFHADSATAARPGHAVAGKTTSLSATLLFHASRGELPEPAHSLLEAGDADGLLSFGHSSGRGILLGLALACSRRPGYAPSPAAEFILDGIPGVQRTIVRVYRHPNENGAGIKESSRPNVPSRADHLAPVGPPFRC